MATKKNTKGYQDEVITFTPFSVSLYFAGSEYVFNYQKMEKMLDGIATKFGGLMTGSGTNMAGRDFNFNFNTRDQVRKFVSYVRTVRKPRSITVYKTEVEEVTRDISRSILAKRKRKMP